MKGRMLVLALAFLLGSATAFAAGPLDINSADAPSIAAAMHGVGLNKAEAIVAYRKAHGPFASVDELSRVKGIGPATIEQNRSKLVAVPAGGKKAATAKK